MEIVPFAVRNLKSLKTLNLSNNQLKTLPSPLFKLRLDEIDIWHNPSIVPENIRILPIVERKVPNLWELAGRVIITKSLPYNSSTIPKIMTDCLDMAPLCECGLICFFSKIYRDYRELRFQAKSVLFQRNQEIFGDRVFCEKCTFELKRKIERNLS